VRVQGRDEQLAVLRGAANEAAEGRDCSDVDEGYDELGGGLGDSGDDLRDVADSPSPVALGVRPLAPAACAPLFDVILLDVIMPGLHGTEVAMRVKSGPPAWAAIPIVIMSSLDDPDLTLDFRRLGIDAFIDKTRGVTAQVRGGEGG
jgi:CheY-like chemotaxis protein